MKKIYLLLTCILCTWLIISCSSDGSNDSNSGSSPQDGKGGSLATFALKGNYLYTVDYQKLNVFSIQNQENPVKVNQKDIGFNIETLYSLDNFLFIGSRDAMYIYDITNAENPMFLSESQHFTACDPVVANQTHAFVTIHSNTNCGNNFNTLMIYNIENLANPILIHERNLTYPRGLAIHNNYLIICDDELKIFDVTNPAEPTLVLSKNYKFKDVVLYNDILFAFGENEIVQFKWTNNDFLTLEEISKLNY